MGAHYDRLGYALRTSAGALQAICASLVLGVLLDRGIVGLARRAGEGEGLKYAGGGHKNGVDRIELIFRSLSTAGALSWAV